ncbi:ribonuclease H-like domain-containing protein [Tanacetum coccineum]
MLLSPAQSTHEVSSAHQYYLRVQYPLQITYPGHGILLPNAFNAMTLHDPTLCNWNMDTCASIHLNDFIYSLSDVLNMCIYPSVSVGDGYPIPVTNSGHIAIKARLIANGSTQLEVYQLDVKDAFLHGDLSKTVYMHQPLGFRDSARPDYVFLLQEISFGLKQAFSRLGFSHLKLILLSDYCFIASDMTYLGSLNYFLGISVTRDSSGTFLSQRKYATEILERGLIGWSIVLCDCLVGLGPMYNLLQHLYLYMHDPREPHFSTLKQILRYVRGTLDHGLQLFSSSTTSLVAYSDADWAGCPTTRRSTSGYYVFLGNNLLSWSFKRQRFLGLVLRQSIVVLAMLLLRLVDRDNNTCSTSTSYRLFDRQSTIHQLMGGGKAADVLLWKRRRVSLGIIIVATAAWLVFERSGLSFLTICSNVLLFLIVLRFLHANYASMRDKQIQTLPELVLSEEMVNYAAASFRIKVNYMLLMAHDITLGKDFRLFFTVCSGLSVAVICPWKFNIFLHACVYSDSVARLPQSTFEEPVYSLIVVDSFQPIKFFLGQLR